MLLSPDFKDLLTAFGGAGDASPENRERVVRALATFGVPAGLIALVRSMGPGEIVHFGKPPLRTGPGARRTWSTPHLL